MRKGAATRETILEEAGQLAAQIGLGGLTIGALAERTELSKSGLFAHFGSKETLQLQVMSHYVDRITEIVIRPALREPRGEPRLRSLFDRWLVWAGAEGGCPLVAASFEFDDQPGRVREQIVAHQRDWLDTLTMIATGAVTEGHFRADLDTRQLAVDIEGVLVSFHILDRLLGDPEAATRARRSFEALLAAAR